jgi:carboxyl-terminal processing protease
MDNRNGVGTTENRNTASQTRKQREKILAALGETVKKRFYDRGFPETKWSESLAKYREQILNASSLEEFEREVTKLLSTLGASHVGFYHAGLARSSAKMALCANYVPFSCPDGERWVFQDVHEGGPAAIAGLRSGDILIAVDGCSIRPPEHPTFAIPSTIHLTVVTRGMNEVVKTVTIPQSHKKTKQLPYVEPNPIVTSRRLNFQTGYLRVVIYPGQVGINVANEMSASVQALGDIDRLIVDLRGNTGGGVAFLRLLSLLTPDRLPVATFHKGTKASMDDRVEAQGAFVLDRIPERKLQLYRLAARFTGFAITRQLLKKRLSVSLFTEGLGHRRFHGRVVLLVDRHTASGNEVLLEAANKHCLATVVGEPTPGRVLGGEKFKLPHGYWVALPVGSYQATEKGALEGRPIIPDIVVPFDPDAAREGKDSQLEKALEVASGL